MERRIIMHLDLDAFFASVEEVKNPAIKGKPVIVGADPKGGKGRGVVATSNYKARKFGIRSAMPISIAYKKCPDGVFLRPDFKSYSKASRRVMEIIKKRSEKTEQVSIDEIFVDLTGVAKNFSDAKKIAKDIREEIYEKEKLTCSIGISLNKLLAKMASDYKKPRGLTLVLPGGVRKFLNPLPARKIPGVGKKTDEHLKKIGIETIEHLASYPEKKLEKEFGSFARHLKESAFGIDNSPVIEIEETKSISRETTLEKDSDDKKTLKKILSEIAGEVFHDSKKEGVSFRTISIKVRFEDFKTFTRAKSLPVAVRSGEALQKISLELFEEFLEQEKKIRLIGVRVSNLSEDKAQRTLL